MSSAIIPKCCAAPAYANGFPSAKFRNGFGSPLNTGSTAAPEAKTTKSELTSLEHVPLAMIGGFTLTPKLKTAAKHDPLVALAVQVDKAMGPDASDLDRARLVAMANAVARGDLATFWSASAERSKKKLGG